mgnify:CR=1 FL=1|jgi:hypothetical protein
MNKKLSIVSYTLATMAGVCFISGLAILSSEGRM